MLTTTQKRCFKCGENKPRSEFYRHARMADGLLGKCKQCTKADVLRHRAANLEKTQQYDRDRARLPHRANKRRIYVVDNPEKVRAVAAVYRALQRGDLARPDACAHCQQTCKPVGHHEDYSRQLDVVWLCRSCHRKVHI